MQKTDATASIAALRETLARHDALYYGEAAPVITDAQYDALKRQLSDLEAAYPLFAGVPAAAGVGDDRRPGFVQVAHSEPMLSLDNAYSFEELQAFEKRLQGALGQLPTYCVEPKVDGVAVSCVYQKGQLLRVVTRGNGLEGDDVTLNLLHLPKIQRIAAPFDYLELRGEVYLLQSDFERINQEREEDGLTPFANARNLAAGSLKLLDPKAAQKRSLKLLFYGLGACSEQAWETQEAFLTTLKAWELPVNEPFFVVQGLAEAWKVIEQLDVLRHTLPYGTDGAVLKLNERAFQKQLGATAKAPRWAIAYKFAPSQAQTRLHAITLQVGRTGVVTPVAQLEPVVLDGSRIVRATLHNADEIARKDIRVGDWVVLEKAGEVIPAIVSVVLERRQPDTPAFVFPKNCPSCEGALTRLPQEVAWRCLNATCPAQVRRRLEHFASRQAMDIKHLGEAVIALLVERSGVGDFADIYALTPQDLLCLPQFKERAVQNLLEAIEASRQAPLWRVVHGLGIPLVGATMAKELVSALGSMAILRQADVPTLSRLPGVGPLGAASIVHFFASPANQELLDRLEALGVGTQHSPPAHPQNPLAGKRFVLTGTLQALTRAEACERLEALGARVVATLSSKVDYLVVGQDPGSKYAKAKELGICIWDEEQLLAALGEEF